MERKAFTSFDQDSRLTDKRILGKFPRSQHRPFLITPPKLKVPVQSIVDPVKRYNFCKADWKRFCLLTDQSIERLLPADTSNIERAYKIFARAYFLRPNNVSHVAAGRTTSHAGTKSATLIEPLHPTTTEKAGAMRGSCEFY